MDPKYAAGQVRLSREFFCRTIECLTEEDSDFTPVEGIYSVAHHVAHAAFTVDWFIEGAFRPEGFDMDFEAHDKAARAVTSLTEARAMLDRSFESAAALLESKTAEELAQPIPDGPIMGGAPIYTLVHAIEEHTAHHRGALSIYARCRGKVPAMPYGGVEAS